MTRSFPPGLAEPTRLGKQRVARSRVQLERPQGARCSSRGGPKPFPGWGYSSWWGRGGASWSQGCQHVKSETPNSRSPVTDGVQAALGSGTTDNRGPLASSMENKGTRMLQTTLIMAQANSTASVHELRWAPQMDAGRAGMRKEPLAAASEATHRSQDIHACTAGSSVCKSNPARTHLCCAQWGQQSPPPWGGVRQKGLLVLWEPHSRATLVSKARSHAHYCKSANVSPKKEEGKWEDEK